jgi:autotransporter-associated beta strand protein
MALTIGRTRYSGPKQFTSPETVAATKVRSLVRPLRIEVLERRALLTYAPPVAYAQDVTTIEDSPATITLAASTENAGVPQKNLTFIYPPSGSPSSLAQNVLFLGNSLTYTYNIPALFANLASSAGLPTPNVVMNAGGGETIEQQAVDPAALSLIQSGFNGAPWNYVVMQDVGWGPTAYGDPTGFNPSITQIYDDIEKYNPNAKVVLYETCGESPNTGWFDYYADGTTPGAGLFQDLPDQVSQLRESYLNAAYQYTPMNSTSAVKDQIWMAPCGDAAIDFLDNPGIYNPFLLWRGDYGHPSPQGAYLIACVIFESIYDQSAAGLPFVDSADGVDAATTTYLQSIAATVMPLTSGPAHGTLSVLSSGVWKYTPNPGYFGPDSFQFEVAANDAVDPTICQYSTPVTVNINVEQLVPPTVAAPASAAPDIVSGTTTALSVLGADADWGEANLSYAWSVTSQPAAAAAPQFSVNGNNAAKNTTVTFSQAGTYVFQVTIADSHGLTATSSVDVTVDQTLNGVTVSPALVSLDAANTQQFTATGWDQFGDVLIVQPAWTWTLSGEGNVDSNGLYTPPEATGSATITAAGGNFAATASVAYAGHAVWDSSGFTSWNSSGAWSDSAAGSVIAAPGLRGITGDTATFEAVCASTVTLDGANPSLAAITFGNANDITISQGTGGALFLANSGGSGSLTVSAGSQTVSAPLVLGSNLLVLPVAGSTLAISGAISGPGEGVTVNDLGTVTLSGANSYSGGTIVTSGTLVAASAGALPAGSSLLVGAGSLFALGGSPVQAATSAGFSSGGMSDSPEAKSSDNGVAMGVSASSLAGTLAADSIPAPGRQSPIAGLEPGTAALMARDMILAQLSVRSVFGAEMSRPISLLSKQGTSQIATSSISWPEDVWNDLSSAATGQKDNTPALDAVLAAYGQG